jgi:hypothetical protein
MAPASVLVEALMNISALMRVALSGQFWEAGFSDR